VVEEERDKPEIEVLEADAIAPPEPVTRTTLLDGGVFTSFRYRDFRILWSGAFVSNTGTWIHTTVLLWFVKELTDSNAWVGAVNLANYLPVFILVLWSGSLADRLDRRKMILATQSLMMLGALALGICVSAGWTSLPVIISITAIMGVAFVFNFPAWRAIIPDLVPRENMLNGIALDAAQFNLARSVGPMLAIPVLAFWNVETAFYLNAASFLTVIIALLFIRTPTPGSLRREGTLSHMTEGIRYAFGRDWSRNLLIVLAVLSFFGLSFLVLLPGLAKDELGKGSGGYSALLAALGIGAVIGAPLVTLLRRYLQERDIIRYSVLGFGICLLAISFCGVYWLCLLFTMGAGITALMLSATINTILQARVEREMRGRMMSLYILVFQGIFPIGGLALGLASDALSVRTALLIGAMACITAGLTITLAPSLLRNASSMEV
jgi:MFS family permease